MITSITLKNFMSWENQTFDLSNGVNIICGMSDKGKSAILDAIEWVRNNRPLGNEFASDWIKKQNKKGEDVLFDDCEVKINFTNGQWVSRIIGKDINEYRISTIDKPLQALNKSVPQEVVDLLNLSDTNIQEQSNPYFLFALSSPEIGRQLNQIASLSDIDTGFKNANTEILELNRNIKQNNFDTERLTQELDNFAWLQRAQNHVEEINQIVGQLSYVQEKERKFRNLNTKIIDINERLSKFSFINNIEKDLNILLLQEKEIKNIVDKFKDKFNKLVDIESRLLDIEEKLKKSIDYESIEKEINRLFNFYNEIIIITKKLNIFSSFEDRIMALQQNIDEISENITITNIQYEKIKPSICPLCEREWK